MPEADSAVMWLKISLLLSLCICNVYRADASLDGASGTSRSECGALQLLFWATQGQDWRQTWDVQNEFSDPCLHQWYGIACDDDGHIVSIRLAGNNLNGFLPPEFPRPSLSFLQELDLSSNFLTGVLPDSLSRLTALRTLRLDQNIFVGSVPSSIGSLILLEYLELQGNQFDAAYDGKILPDEVQALAHSGHVIF